VDGVVNVCKTGGPTSHDVVDDVRRLFAQRRVGHAGTLDPMATGVLVICLGKATRIVEYLVGMPKEYRARMVLGVSTDTQDSTGVVISEKDASYVTEDDFKRAIKSFVGEIEQIPPMTSAIKHQGKALYKLAREGKVVERAPRKVTIYGIDILDIIPGSRAEAEILVRCSSGTYIRTLCSDIGNALGCGGHMSMLERTRVGMFDIERSVTVDQLRQAKLEGRLDDHVYDMSNALKNMPAMMIDSEGERRIMHGLPIDADNKVTCGVTVRILGTGEDLLALGVVTEQNGRLIVKPRKVLIEPAG